MIVALCEERVVLEYLRCHHRGGVGGMPAVQPGCLLDRRGEQAVVVADRGYIMGCIHAIIIFMILLMRVEGIILVEELGGIAPQ